MANNIGINSQYLRNKIIDHITGIATYTKPSANYLALYTTNPTINDTGTEVSGGGYARQAIDYGTASNGANSNDAAINFTMPNPTIVTHWGIRDASSGGNLLYFGKFDVPLVLSGSVSIDVGDLAVSED